MSKQQTAANGPGSANGSESIHDAESTEGVAGPLLFIMGPTASGKTSLALALADHFPLEIVNADSVQVYRGFTIGAAKPTPRELEQVPHHLIDCAEPDDPFSAARYRQAALSVIRDCRRRGLLPALVGGSGLYFRAVEQGLAPVPAIDPARVQALNMAGRRDGWPALHQRLAARDPDGAARLAPGDSQRIVRALSVVEQTGKTLAHWQRQPLPTSPFNILKIAPEHPRELLYERINARYEIMLKQGLMQEARALWESGLSLDLPAMKAVGYRQLFHYFAGDISQEEAITLAKRESRRYAKRQETWLRREKGLIRLSPERAVDEAIALVSPFIQQNR